MEASSAYRGDKPNGDLIVARSPAPGDSSYQQSPYGRAPLHLPREQIRLLRVLPRDSSRGIIRFCFEIVPIAECPSFVALSYTWGRPDEPYFATIELESSSFPVYRNLYEFLDRISREETDSLFWIDALCIDQENKSEKQYQIPLIRLVYYSASRVIVWLGKLPRTSDAAIRLMERLYTTPNAGVASQLDVTSTIYKELVSLCNERYWSRVWIVQEVICAQNLVVYYRNGSFRWESLAYLLKDFTSRPTSMQTLTITTTSAALVFKAKSNWDWKRRPPLHHLIDTYRHMQCSRAQDGIYALIGLAKQDIVVDIDYDKSRQDIVLEVLVKACRAAYFPDLEYTLPIARRLLCEDRTNGWLAPSYSELALPYSEVEHLLRAAGLASETWNGALDSKSCEHVCPHFDHCGTKPFRKRADLQRHLLHYHSQGEEQWVCDYGRCLRQREPFHRKKHLEEHLSEVHCELLWTRRVRRNISNPSWLKRKIVNEDWWRCQHCLKRILKKTSGWFCSTCSRALEPEAIKVMESRMYHERE